MTWLCSATVMMEELTVHGHTALSQTNLALEFFLCVAAWKEGLLHGLLKLKVDTCATQRQPSEHTPSLSSYFLVKKHTPYQLKARPPLTSWLGALPLNLVKYNPCHDLALLTESSLFLPSSKASTYCHHDFRRTSSLSPPLTLQRVRDPCTSAARLTY